MALSRHNGIQASLRDVYPNLTGALAVFEATNPEDDELDHYNAPATAVVDAADGTVQPIRRGHLWQMVGMIAVAVLLLWLLNKA